MAVRGAERAPSIKVMGQDLDVIIAVFANILSWLVATFATSLLPHLLPTIDEEDRSERPSPSQTKCIAIGRPGGMEQLRLVTLKPGYVTRGYNVGTGSPFVDVSCPDGDLPPGTVVLKVVAFSVNYADCCIRWGLYESANRFVGWPIVPGFDVAGVVERVSSSSSSSDHAAGGGGGNASSGRPAVRVGDRVYGATFFGAYSTRCLVPAMQLYPIPDGLGFAEAASIPAVSLTALYGLHLGGRFPPPSVVPSNNAILIHSAAGGVGSMMVQMAKLLQMAPVVGVVGRTSKVEPAAQLGCDVVIDKCQEDLWEAAKKAAENRGYAIIADANGVSTLQDSYENLAPTGRLVVFGFHSNLPLGQDLLNPMEWVRMILKVARMPKFDAMDLVASNKSVLGFNLSFFVDEIEMLGSLYGQIGEWLTDGKLHCPRVTELPMHEIAEAHKLIQSGQSVGKIVMLTGEDSG
jgi:NADPH:quinone reductase-like Zn-dependent oxidoreductase